MARLPSDFCNPPFGYFLVSQVNQNFLFESNLGLREGGSRMSGITRDPSLGASVTHFISLSVFWFFSGFYCPVMWSLSLGPTEHLEAVKFFILFPQPSGALFFLSGVIQTLVFLSSVSKRVLVEAVTFVVWADILVGGGSVTFVCPGCWTPFSTVIVIKGDSWFDWQPSSQVKSAYYL